MSYTKQTWATGDVITAEKLNHMEDGIEDAGSGGGSSEPISITYSALKALRDNDNLVSGAQYRITDYVCTVNPEVAAYTRAVSHPFDIIVTALSTGILSESAKACRRDDDTYYINANHSSDLSCWELKYDIDDTMYSDPQNSKGWITYMKDDKDNECPYDFKQIQFSRYKIVATEAYMVGCYTAPDHSELITQIDETPEWFYTFSLNDSPHEDNLRDASVELGEKDGYKFFWAFNNKILSSLDNVFYIGPNGHGITNNFIGMNACGNTFHNTTKDNTIGGGCFGIVTTGDFSGNTVGEKCTILASADCMDNVIYRGCAEIIMNGECTNNHIYSNCEYLTLSPSVQNHHIFSGVSGTSSAQLVINPVTGDPVTFVCKNSSGTVKTWNPADLAP